MALSPAYVVDGGRVPAQMLRMTLWASTSGANGVCLPGDLRVQALAVPGGAVNVLPGGAILSNSGRFPGTSGTQSFAAVNATTEQLTIPATGSGSGRTDYVILRIDDWHFDGSAQPADPKTALYCSFRRVSSLAGLAYPYVALAKITIPASTGTITQAMITDLREVALPRRESVARFRTQTGADDPQRLTSTTRQLWPAEGGWQLVDVPGWATRVQIKATWSQIKFDADAQTGRLWLSWGDWVAADGQYELRTDTIMYDAAAGSTSRQTIVLVADMYVPTKYRGKTDVRFAFQGKREIGTGPLIDQVTALGLELTFLEVADPSTT